MKNLQRENVSAPTGESVHSGTGSRGRSVWLSATVAATVVAGLLASGQVERLPALGWAAAFLFLVIEHDVRTLRIPNWLTFSALAAVLIHAGFSTGLAGFSASLAGTGLAFALLFPAFAIGWLGAGDVKAVMVLGALWGASTLPGLLWWMVVSGGLLAIAYVVVRGGAIDLLRRWGRSLKTLLTTGSWLYIPPTPGSAAARGIPFGIAMGLGVAGQQLWGFSWV